MTTATEQSTGAQGGLFGEPETPPPAAPTAAPPPPQPTPAATTPRPARRAAPRPPQQPSVLIGERPEVDEEFKDKIVLMLTAMYRTTVIARFRKFGATAAQVAADFPTMWCSGGFGETGVTSVNIDRRTPSEYLKCDSPWGTLLTLTAEEFGDACRRLYEIPDPVSAQERERLVAEQVEEARDARRKEAPSQVRRQLDLNGLKQKVTKGALRAARRGQAAAPSLLPHVATPAEQIAELLYGDDLLTAEGERALCLEIYRRLLDLFPDAHGHKAMTATAAIVSLARTCWESDLTRLGVRERDTSAVISPAGGRDEAAEGEEEDGEE